MEEAQIALDVAEASLEGAVLEDVTSLWEERTDETRRAFLREVVERVDVAPARRKRNVPLADRVRLDFRGLDGDPVLEMTEVDVKDRRRRWEQGVTGRRRRAREQRFRRTDSPIR